jgi:hypothetical protein
MQRAVLFLLWKMKKMTVCVLFFLDCVTYFLEKENEVYKFTVEIADKNRKLSLYYSCKTSGERKLWVQVNFFSLLVCFFISWSLEKSSYSLAIKLRHARFKNQEIRCEWIQRWLINQDPSYSDLFKLIPCRYRL